MNVSVSFAQHLIEEMCIRGGEIPTSSPRNIPLLAILPLEPLSGLLRKSRDKEVGVV